MSRFTAIVAVIICCIIGYVALVATNHPIQAHQFGVAAFWGCAGLAFFLL